MGEEIEIGKIANFYGGLVVKNVEGKYFWAIDGHDSYGWEEIPKTLYDEIIKFQNKVVLDDYKIR